jgi:hypothetical protein
MQITEQTPTTLALQTNAGGFGCLPLLFGVPFLVSGLAVMLLLGKLTTLDCKRVEPTQVACNLTSAGLLGKQTTSIPAGQLQGADVGVSRGDDGDTYRVILVTKTMSIIPLTGVYSSGYGGKRQKADRINAFVNDSSQMSLTIQQDDRWFAYIFGGIFTLVGGISIMSMIMVKLPRVYVFDKKSGYLYVTFRSLIQSETKQFRLRDIQSAQVVESTDSDGDKSLQTQLNLRSGNPMQLQVFGDSTKHHAIAQAINTFLDSRS